MSKRIARLCAVLCDDDVRLRCLSMSVCSSVLSCRCRPTRSRETLSDMLSTATKASRFVLCRTADDGVVRAEAEKREGKFKAKGLMKPDLAAPCARFKASSRHIDHFLCA